MRKTICCALALALLLCACSVDGAGSVRPSKSWTILDQDTEPSRNAESSAEHTNMPESQTAPTGPSEASEPVTTRPEQSEPERTEPEPTQTEATQTEATQTEPVKTEPVTEPTEPEPTEPEPQTEDPGERTLPESEPDPDEEPGYSYIGNKNSKKFHLPTCTTLPYPENRVYFETREEAIQQGYVPCKRCNP